MPAKSDHVDWLLASRLPAEERKALEVVIGGRSDIDLGVKAFLAVGMLARKHNTGLECAIPTNCAIGRRERVRKVELLNDGHSILAGAVQSQFLGDDIEAHILRPYDCLSFPDNGTIQNFSKGRLLKRYYAWLRRLQLNNLEVKISH